MATQGMSVAARLANLPSDWQDWTPEMLEDKDASFALLSLKAMAFLELRRSNAEASVALLEKLKLLDPSDGIGGSVVAALAESL